MTVVRRMSILLLMLTAAGCADAPRKPKVTSEEPSSASTDVVETKASDPDEVIPITYEDLDLPMEPDSLFADWMLTQRIRDLDGKNVRITGFMCAGSIFTQNNIKNFMMLREKECPYGPGGQAHHVIAVELEGVTASYTTDPVTVEGKLSVRPFTGPNGKTWAVYHLSGTKFE